MSIYLGNLEPGARYRIDSDGRAVKTKSSARKQILQGWAVHYNVPHINYQNNLTESFARGCFTGSLYSVMFLRDHKLTEKKIADQDDGDLELHDSDAGLAMRVHLKEGTLEKLDGRRELSVGYRIFDSKLRYDGVRVIRNAALIEISACYEGAVRQTFTEICDADSVGTLAEDSKNFGYEGASHGFLRALREMQ
jgi:phage head maturation protease